MNKKILILNLFLAATESMIDPTLLLGNISLAIYILESDLVWWIQLISTFLGLAIPNLNLICIWKKGGFILISCKCNALLRLRT